MKCPYCGGPRDREKCCCVYCGMRFDQEANREKNKQEIHIYYHQENRPDPQVRVERMYPPMEQRSDKSRLVALLLCLFLGMFGVHRFYLGKIGTGVVYLLTEGVFAIGWLVDLCILIFGSPKDKDGYRLTWH